MFCCPALCWALRRKLWGLTSLSSPVQPTVLKSPGPIPQGSRTPSQASAAGLDPRGPCRHDVTAHMFWLLAAPAPIKQRGQLWPVALAGPKCKLIWITPAQTSKIRCDLLQEGCLDAPRLVGMSYGLPQLPGFPPWQPSPHWLVTHFSLHFPSGSSRFGGCSPGVGSGAGER